MLLIRRQVFAQRPAGMQVLRCAAQLDSTGAQVDLVLTLAESGDELTGTLEFCADLYTDDTVSRMADHFLVRLLEAASATLSCCMIATATVSVLCTCRW